MVDAATECKTTMDFHPCDTPRGMSYYKLKDLDSLQQTVLNQHKLQIIKENQKYLKNHPEVGVAVKLILDEVLKSRPLKKIPEFISNYFDRNSDEIVEKMSEAVDRRRAEEEQERKLSEVATRSNSIYSKYSAEGEEDNLEQVTIDYLAYDAVAGESEESERSEHSEEHSENAMLICYEIIEELVKGVTKQEIPSDERLPYTDSDPMLDFPYDMKNFEENYPTSIS